METGAKTVKKERNALAMGSGEVKRRRIINILLLVVYILTTLPVCFPVVPMVPGRSGGDSRGKRLSGSGTGHAMA
jgi:flagellar basal body-associated protein FliL